MVGTSGISGGTGVEEVRTMDILVGTTDGGRTKDTKDMDDVEGGKKETDYRLLDLV